MNPIVRTDTTCSECGKGPTAIVHITADDPHECVNLCAVCLLTALVAVIDAPQSEEARARLTYRLVSEANEGHPWQAAMAVFLCDHLRRS